jgi:hypothetical protein
MARARPKEQIGILVSAGASAFTALLMSIVFTFLYAGKVPTVAWLSATAWILLLAAAVGAMFYLWYRQEFRARTEDTDGGMVIQPGAPLVVLGFAVISLLWVFIAHWRGDKSMLFNMHWIVQLVLLGGTIFVLSQYFLHYSGSAGAERSFILQQNGEKRVMLVEDLNKLRQSDWIKSFAQHGAGGRLRASLNWWDEELGGSVPDKGPLLGHEAVSLYLDEARRQISWLQALNDRKETREEAIEDAERRVLEAIDWASSLARRFNN